MTVPSLAVQRDPRYERWRWTILAVTWVAYVGFYFTRKSFAVAKVGLLDDPVMGLDKSAMGVIDLGYGIAYAIGQFLCGMWCDRVGSRRVVLAGMIASIAAAVAMGLSTDRVLFGLLFFAQGLCQSAGWAPLTKNVSNWFSRRERGRVFGLWSTNYAIGGVLASAAAGFAALHFGGWRYAFLVPPAALALIALAFFVWQRNRPEDAGLPPIDQYHGEPAGPLPTAETKESAAAPGGAFAMFRLVLANPMILRLGVIYFLLKPIRYALLFWGPLIIHERIKTDIGQTAFISAFFEAAGPVGVVLAGWASDRLFGARRIPVIVIGLAGLAVILFSFNAITATQSRLATILVLAGIGCFLFGPDSLIVSTSAVDFAGKDGAGSATGFINGMGSTGQILGLSLPGFISERYGWDALFTGMGCFITLAVLLLAPSWNVVSAPARGHSR
jgi:OPA family sugar phosphate sensor protein UhpC-like MFS transporter